MPPEVGPHELDTRDLVRVTAMPRRPRDAREHPILAAALAGVLDAGARGVPLSALWVRPSPNDALQVFVTGSVARWAGDPRTEPPDLPLSFPVGAVGCMPNADDLSALLDGFEWVTCGGSFDPLVEPEAENDAAVASPETLDRQVEYLVETEFAWLVSATPRPSVEVEADATELLAELYRLRRSGDIVESDAVAVKRYAAWFREVARSSSAGVWDVSLRVGARETAVAERVASALCAAAELSVTGYRFRSRADEIALRRPVEDADALSAGVSNPFPATADLVARMIRPPLVELPGLRLMSEPTFDTAPEPGVGTDGVEIGDILDRFRRPTGKVRLPSESLKRHTFVCGATGSGKSYTIRQLLESLSRQAALPWLVIEPAKAEYYHGMLARLDIPGLEIDVIRPGSPELLPVSVNPLEPSTLEDDGTVKTFPLQSHADLIRSLFMASFPGVVDPFPQLLSQALTNAYESYGWDLATGEAAPARAQQLHLRDRPGEDVWTPRYPGLYDLIAEAEKVVQTTEYSAEGRRDVAGYVNTRIRSLTHGTPGQFLTLGHPLDFASLLKRNVVLELETVTDDREKAFVMGVVLIRLYEQLWLKHRGGDAPLGHVTVLEEAHRLLRRQDDDSLSGRSIELFASLLAEVRAYGEGIVVAEQIPSKLIDDVIKNTAVKVVHRLPAADDREAVGATMNLTPEQSEAVVALGEGYAAVFVDKMDRPVLARSAYSEREENAKHGEAKPVASAALVGPRSRSVACHAQCRQGEPCDLATIQSGRALLLEYPEVTLWAEAACVAHAYGRVTPRLKDSQHTRDVRSLWDKDPRVVECAAASAIEQAVTPRYPLLGRDYDPDSLAKHLADVFRSVMADPDAHPCEHDDGRWRARTERYRDVEEALRSSPRDPEREEAIDRAQKRGASVSDGASPEYVVRTLHDARQREAEREALLLGGGAAVKMAERLLGVGAADKQLEAALKRTLDGDGDDEVIAAMVGPVRKKREWQDQNASSPEAKER